MNNTRFTLKPQTVKLISRMIAPLLDTGILSNLEYNTISTQLSYIAKHGEPMPSIVPKLITTQEAADMLSISCSQFRALERDGVFPFKRRSIGGKTVRYKNTDILEYMDTSIVIFDGVFEDQVSEEDSDSDIPLD